MMLSGFSEFADEPVPLACRLASNWLIPVFDEDAVELEEELEDDESESPEEPPCSW